jgi:hypothetical protein
MGHQGREAVDSRGLPKLVALIVLAGFNSRFCGRVQPRYRLLDFAQPKQVTYAVFVWVD